MTPHYPDKDLKPIGHTRWASLIAQVEAGHEAMVGRVKGCLE